MTSIKKNLQAKASEKDSAKTAQLLKEHAQALPASKIDAKSIILMDGAGNVQEPTTETVNLLGSRTSGAYRKLKRYQGASESVTGMALADSSLTTKRPRRSDESDKSQAAENEVFQCNFPGCNKQFRQTQYLKAHMAYHQSRANFVCSVPSCGKSFNYRHNLSIHMRVHNDDRPFECPQTCGKRFRTKGNMMDHLRRHYAVK